MNYPKEGRNEEQVTSQSELQGLESGSETLPKRWGAARGLASFPDWPHHFSSLRIKEGTGPLPVMETHAALAQLQPRGSLCQAGPLRLRHPRPAPPRCSPLTGTC